MIKDPHLIVEKEGLIQQSDPKELERIISEMLSKNQDKVTQYKSGKEKLFGYFVGEVMKISKSRANPQLVNEILKTKLIVIMLKNIEVTQDLLDYIYNHTQSITSRTKRYF